ncbi:MAG: phage tail tape measure protein, partial [Parvularcula sp.]|nr:phage tail tape measure protein [Parvularcula sp.]
MAGQRVSVLLDIRSKLDGVNRAQAGFGNLIKSVAGFAAAYVSARGVINGARDIIGLGAKMNHLAGQTGIAESELLALGQAFDDAGAGASNVGTTISRMQRRLMQASRTGTGRVADELGEMGVNIDELMRMSPAEQFNTIAEKISKIEDPTQRSAAAMNIFGRSGAQLLPLFRNGGALDDARESLGAMPEVLERNAV